VSGPTRFGGSSACAGGPCSRQVPGCNSAAEKTCAQSQKLITIKTTPLANNNWKTNPSAVCVSASC